MEISQLFTDLVFLSFGLMLIGASLMTILSRNPVRSALFLVLAFFAASGLWIMLEAEFLGLVLILVYVGAVMTLFLFVVMTLNVDTTVLRKAFVHYLPYAVTIVGMLVLMMIYVLSPEHYGMMQQAVEHGKNYSNIKEIGAVLYTDYAYPFEVAGVILLVAMVAAISLTFRGRQHNKSPRPEKQILVQPADRVRIVQMKSETK